MNHSTAIFNQNLYQLTFHDIEHFFVDNKQESLHLEFKSYPTAGDHVSKENAVKKSVCALLNSEGGIIIWGAPVEIRDQQGNTSAIGQLTPFQTDLDKDRLINKLSSIISPMPIGIRVQQLQNAAQHSIFIIEVEKSLDRPHQFDNKYYIRLDGQTRIAPHYLIKALMTSIDYPNLKGQIRLKNIDSDGHNINLTFRKLLFNTSTFNNELNVRYRIAISVGTIYIGGVIKGVMYDETFPILSHGSPLMSDFVVSVPANQINNEITIVLHFTGEKSPSKTSVYKYRFQGNLNFEDVNDENIYLTEKKENKLPSDVANHTSEEMIEMLLSN